MGNVIRKEQCPNCAEVGGDTSRNNLVVYEDLSSYCFACNYTVPSKTVAMPKVVSISLIEGICADLPVRKISQTTCEFFNYQVGSDHYGEQVQIANYYYKGKVVGQKLRGKDKKFTAIGNMKFNGLWGSWKWSPNSKLSIVITEGEIDAMSIAEVQGCKFPVVSLKSGAAGVIKDLEACHEFLSGFKNIVLAFDNDEAGKQAVEKVLKRADLFEPHKIKIVNWPEGIKDANELLIAGRADELNRLILNSTVIKPEGIITFGEITCDDILASISTGHDLKYPLLNDMLKGLRRQSIYTLVAREKSGKTTFTKELALGLIEQGIKIGLLYLEGDAKEEAISIAGMVRNLPMWRINERLQSDASYANTIKAELDKLDNAGLYIYDHKGVIDISSIYSVVSYMARVVQCDVIILDNLSISLAGTDAASNERKLIDNTVFKLVSLVNQTKCTLINVVHVVKNRKSSDGEDSEQITASDVHGSGAFAKFSQGLIALERHSDGIIKLNVLRNRYGGVEGYADMLYYNDLTGRMITCQVSSDN